MLDGRCTMGRDQADAARERTARRVAFWDGDRVSRTVQYKVSWFPQVRRAQPYLEVRPREGL